MYILVRAVTTKEQKILLALIAGSFNSLMCVYRLTITGYFVQAMNVARLPVENLMAYWYLRNFPCKYEVFTNPQARAPSYNDMLNSIKGLHRPVGIDRDFDAFRDLISSFHKFSHARSTTVLLTLRNADRNADELIGPRRDVEQLHGTFHDTHSVVGAVLWCANDLLSLMNLDQSDQLPGLLERVIQHLRRTP